MGTAFTDHHILPRTGLLEAEACKTWKHLTKVKRGLLLYFGAIWTGHALGLGKPGLCRSRRGPAAHIGH